MTERIEATAPRTEKTWEPKDIHRVVAVSSEVARSSFPPPHRADTARGRRRTEEAPPYRRRIRAGSPGTDALLAALTTNLRHRHAHPDEAPTPPPIRHDRPATRVNSSGPSPVARSPHSTLRVLTPRVSTAPHPFRLQGRTDPRQHGRHPAGKHHQAAESGRPTGAMTSPIHSRRITPPQGQPSPPQAPSPTPATVPVHGLMNSAPAQRAGCPSGIQDPRMRHRHRRSRACE